MREGNPEVVHGRKDLCGDRGAGGPEPETGGKLYLLPPEGVVIWVGEKKDERD